MGIALKEMMDRLPEERRRRVEERTAELVAEEMTLRDLRKAMGKTQAAVAEKLGLKQENVSRVEQRADMLLSTLDGYLRAMGGHLRLVVEFKDRAPVRLSGLSAIEPPVTRRATGGLVLKRGKTLAVKPAASKAVQAQAVRTRQRKTGLRRPATTAKD